MTAKNEVTSNSPNWHKLEMKATTAMTAQERPGRKVDWEDRAEKAEHELALANDQLAEARALVNKIRQLNVLSCTHQERWKKLLESAEFNRACHAEPRTGRDLEGK